MKRVLSWVLLLCLALSMAGCGPGETGPSDSVSSAPSAEASLTGGGEGLTVEQMFPSQADRKEEPEEEPEPAETAEPSATPVPSQAAVAPSVKTEEPEPATPVSVTVYVTKTGEKYHKSGCQYLRKSKIAIDLDDAITEGYTACSKCGPPRG